MFIPHELHINFQLQGNDYDISLVKGDKGKHTVEINGATFTVLGNEDRLHSACDILKSVSLESISNSEDLKKKLSILEGITFPQTQKTDNLGTQILKTTIDSPAVTNKSIFNDHEITEIINDLCGEDGIGKYYFFTEVGAKCVETLRKREKKGHTRVSILKSL